MGPTKYLKQLRQKTVHRLYKLQNLADRASRLSLSECDRTISYVVIECLNTWANFTRAYFLSCVLSPHTETGVRITLSNTSISTFDKAIEAAIRRLKPWILSRGSWGRRDEPIWHEPRTLIECCNEIGCSHYPNILAAFSVPTKVFEHLPTVRNFYAHRNEDTARSAKNIARYYTISTDGHPTEILCTPAYSRPQILILDWIDDMVVIIELLCE